MKGELKELDEFLANKIEQLPEIEESKDFLDAKKKTEEALVKRYLEIRERIQLLENPVTLNTIGDYLSIFLQCKKLSLSDLCGHVKISEDVIRPLTHTPSSDLLNIAPNILAKVCQAIDLTLENALILLRKTFQLASLEIATSHAMARYSPKTDEKKSSSMKKGVQELLLKASANKPFKKQIDALITSQIETYLQSFQESYLEQ
jgi:hypothetical protein